MHSYVLKNSNYQASDSPPTTKVTPKSANSEDRQCSGIVTGCGKVSKKKYTIAVHDLFPLSDPSQYICHMSDTKKAYYFCLVNKANENADKMLMRRVNMAWVEIKNELENVPKDQKNFCLPSW